MCYPQRLRKPAERPRSSKNLLQNGQFEPRLHPWSTWVSMEDLVASTMTRFVFQDGYRWKTGYSFERTGVSFITWIVQHDGSQLGKVWRVNYSSRALSHCVLWVWWE